MKIFAILIFSLFSTLLFGAQEKTLTLPRGDKLVAVTSFSRSTQENPTLIFLPGIYRGFLSQEPFLEKLTEKHMNWIALHFSRHPRPILKGSQILDRQVDSAQLAQELQSLKTALKISKPIVVSLSFSSSVIPFLDPQDFPVVIETAPMGRSEELSPPQNAYTDWKNWIESFPVWGRWVVQSTEFWAYRSFWRQKVEELTQSNPDYKKNPGLIAEGLAQLAWSAKEFDLRHQDFRTGPQRFWILGENENPARLKIQMAAFHAYQKAHPQEKGLFVVKGAGHIVPVDQPERYAQVLEKILKKIAN